jgi:tripartite-type tricarboxylate transporter receptor subunit TctC
MAFLDGTLAIPNIKSGKLFAVGLSIAKHSVLLPEVAPIADTVSGFDWSGWIAVAGPANMSAPVVKLLADQIRSMQETPQFADLLNAAAMEPTDPIPPEAMAGIRPPRICALGPCDQGFGRHR